MQVSQVVLYLVTLNLFECWQKISFLYPIFLPKKYFSFCVLGTSSISKVGLQDNPQYRDTWIYGVDVISWNSKRSHISKSIYLICFIFNLFHFIWKIIHFWCNNQNCFYTIWHNIIGPTNVILDVNVVSCLHKWIKIILPLYNDMNKKWSIALWAMTRHNRAEIFVYILKKVLPYCLNKNTLFSS